MYSTSTEPAAMDGAGMSPASTAGEAACAAGVRVPLLRLPPLVRSREVPVRPPPLVRRRAGLMRTSGVVIRPGSRPSGSICGGPLSKAPASASVRRNRFQMLNSSSPCAAAVRRRRRTALRGFPASGAPSSPVVRSLAAASESAWMPDRTVDLEDVAPVPEDAVVGRPDDHAVSGRRPGKKPVVGLRPPSAGRALSEWSRQVPGAGRAERFRRSTMRSCSLGSAWESWAWLVPCAAAARRRARSACMAATAKPASLLHGGPSAKDASLSWAVPLPNRPSRPDGPLATGDPGPAAPLLASSALAATQALPPLPCWPSAGPARSRSLRRACESSRPPSGPPCESGPSASSSSTSSSGSGPAPPPDAQTSAMAAAGSEPQGISPLGAPSAAAHGMSSRTSSCGRLASTSARAMFAWRQRGFMLRLSSLRLPTAWSARTSSRSSTRLPSRSSTWRASCVQSGESSRMSLNET
mmetsp:Transcript_108318/g.334540  ORF Transcript_108318/g.334540 Transcript_108318/m.334540 type:complete len:468 (+) Transcript_108318:200-1603(+)